MVKTTVARTVQFLNYVCLLLSVVVFTVGQLLSLFNAILCGVLFLWTSNLFFSFDNRKKRIVFLFFNITLFTFLLARPTISMFRGNVWWYFTDNAVNFSLNILFISLLCLRLGAMLCEFAFKDRKTKLTPITQLSKHKDFDKTLSTISLLFYCITIAFYIITQVEKLVYMHGKEYEELYLTFSSKLPYIFSVLGSMSKYALCIFLATLPSKKLAFGPLAVYVLSAVPALLIGSRFPIVLNILFVLLYYLLRDVLEDKTKWVGKIEKTLIVIALPLGLLLLSAINYIRAGDQVSMGFFESIVDLFYKQGVSYDVLCMAYEALPNLPDVIDKNYTFGSFIDYLTRGTIGQKLFNSISLGTQNSEILAVYGNSFAHSMSYIAHPNYLNGNGWGSSYMLELFADWGYIGLIIGNLIFGMILSFIQTSFRESTTLRVFLLVGLTQLFFVPRSDPTSWLLFIITLQFWLAFVFCYVLAMLCNKKYSINKRMVQ